MVAGRSWTPPKDSAPSVPIHISPRTLHERLGLVDQAAHPQRTNGRSISSSSSTTLLDRVQGINLINASAPMTMTSDPVVFPPEKSDSGTSATSTSNTAPPLEARIPQDSKSTWPIRGQSSRWKAVGSAPRAASAAARPCDEKSLDRGPDRHSDGRNSRESTQPASAEQAGPIRVSEDGEVWRSPPQRPVLSRNNTSLSSLDLPTRAAADRASHQTLPTTTVTSSARKPIDLTKDVNTSVPSKPNFSPLPPFARDSSSLTATSILSRGVPPQGFRKPREPSRPPQIAESSSSRYGDRTSTLDHQSRRHDWQDRSFRNNHRADDGRRCSSYNDPYRHRPTSTYTSYSDRNRDPDASRRNTYTGPREMRDLSPQARGRDNSPPRRTPSDSRSRPILASPARQGDYKFVGEEIMDRRGNPAPIPHNNKSWVRQPATSERTSNVAPESAKPTTSTTTPLEDAQSGPTSHPRPAILEKTAAASSSYPIAAPSAHASKSHATVKTEDATFAPRAPLADREVRQSVPSPPTPAKVVKREPVSPPRAIDIPPAGPRSDAKPLFDPLTHSPEERKPVIRNGFTPPPGPAFLPLQTAVSSGPSVQSAQAPIPTISNIRSDATRPEIAGTSATRNRQVTNERDTSDMEIDELASNSPPSPMPGPGKSSQLPQADSPPITTQEVQAGSTRHDFLPPPPPASTKAPSSKGKERAVDLPASIATLNHPTARKAKKTNSDVISIGSDDDEPVRARRPQPAEKAVPNGTNPQSVPTLPKPQAPSQPSILPKRPPSEERTRVFALPAKVAAAMEVSSKRTPAALRNFLDAKYEELELELQSPLRRIDEIIKKDTIRLVYVELDLPQNEIAIPLPQDCLRSQERSTEERENRKRDFAIQQAVRFALEGRETETTKITPAYLIVGFKSEQSGPVSSKALATVASDSGITAADRVPASFGVPSPRSPMISAPDGQPSRVELLDKKDKKMKKKRKLEGEGHTDDTASNASLESNAGLTRKKDKKVKSKQTQALLDSASSASAAMNAMPAKLPAATPSLSNTKQSHKPAPTTSSTGAGTGSSTSSTTTEARLSFHKPRMSSVTHSMHGSLSHSIKDAREKPRIFFRSESKKKGYLSISMRGHVHYWNAGMPSATLASEDSHARASLGIQTALWSDEHQLAVLGYVATSAAAAANMQLISFANSNPAKGTGIRRTVIQPSPGDDMSGLSALAWDPASGHGLRMAGAEQDNKRVRLWSVTPADGKKAPTLTSLINITTPHSNTIRGILWQKERNMIYTVGVDKRVCTIDPRTCQVVEKWKENMPINRIYRRDANLVVLCMAGNRDQFRCVDLRKPKTSTAVTFSQPTEKGDTLGQYPHGDVIDDYFAYPVDDDLHIWDLRNVKHFQAIKTQSGVIQPLWESTRKMTLLEKKHITTLSF